MATCQHPEVKDSICRVCGECVHEVILNGACYFCGETEISATVKPTPNIVPVSRLRRPPSSD